MAMAAAVFSPVAQKFGADAPLGTYGNIAVIFGESPVLSHSGHFAQVGDGQSNRVQRREISKSRGEFKRKVRRTDFRLRKKFQEEILVGGLAEDYKNLKKCGRVPVVLNVSVLYDGSHNAARFGGLATCGSVWACPVCSRKIQTRRAKEISYIVDEALENRGFKAMMFTFTHPHHAGESLSDLQSRHSRALRAFKGSYWWSKNISKNDKLGYGGNITGDEVTESAVNGWHWHSHMLMLCKNPKAVDVAEAQKRWVHYYKAVCEADGVPFDSKTEEYMLLHGLDIMLECHSSDYLQKMGRGYWGAEKEISGGVGKTGKQGEHYTPFELLEMGRNGLFLEYVEATFGKNQLRFSRGLKEKYGLKDKTDEELLAEEQEHAIVVATVPNKDWQIIVCNDWQAIILEIVEVCGRDALEVWAKANGLNFDFSGCPCQIGDSPPDG